MRVSIFTTNRCAYCAMVKKYLSSKNLTFDEINLDDHPEQQKKAFELSGSLTVPITLITKENGQKDIVIGYNLPQLASLL